MNIFIFFPPLLEPGFLSSLLLLQGLTYIDGPFRVQTAMQWWLGMSVSQCASCYCYPSSFFGLHHDDWYCNDIVTYCQRACFDVQVEVGSGYGHFKHYIYLSSLGLYNRLSKIFFLTLSTITVHGLLPHRIVT